MKKKDSDWIINDLIEKNKVNVVNMSHDDWCVLLKDKSKECNCNPKISVATMEEK
tara:strand:+ start:1473 stop:1637 length:165 start_codon:yes stop_codon:yes gene_type:complete